MVIGYVSAEKERDLGSYLCARLARLWSVAIPALLVTPVLDVLGHAVAPDAYFVPWHGLTSTLCEIGLSALFLNQAHHWMVDPGSNLPYWSLSYEFAYYLLFGFWFFLRGWVRWAALALTAVLVGHRILLLLPVWLIGVAVWYARRRVSAGAGALLFAGSLLAYVMLAATGWGMQLGAVIDSTLLHDRWLGWSKLAGWKYLLGVLVGLNILGMTAMAGWFSWGRAEQPIRRAAGMTLTLYLFHYPLLSFFAAVLPGPTSGLARGLVIAVPTLLCMANIAVLTEQRKEQLRRWLMQMWQGVVSRLARRATTIR
jgi:peptidoglycan/LPS O-acetylase OafA/YrhL